MLKSTEYQKLQLRFLEEHFTLLNPQEAWGRVIATNIFRKQNLQYLKSPLKDVEYWTTTVLCQVALLLAGYTLDIGIYQSFANAVVILCIALVLALVVRLGWYYYMVRKMQRLYVKTFGEGYAPTKDQIGRVRSISRWMTVLLQVPFADGTTIVVVQAPTISGTLLAEDLYRRKRNPT